MLATIRGLRIRPYLNLTSMSTLAISTNNLYINAVGNNNTKWVDPNRIQTIEMTFDGGGWVGGGWGVGGGGATRTCAGLSPAKKILKNEQDFVTRTFQIDYFSFSGFNYKNIPKRLIFIFTKKKS